MAENKNPPVPRFEHPTPSQRNTESELIPKQEKKPRVPAVPSHLRKLEATPNPIEEINNRYLEDALPAKKPRVPSVAEILPDVKIKKKKSKASLENNNERSAAKLQSPKKEKQEKLAGTEKGSRSPRMERF